MNRLLGVGPSQWPWCRDGDCIEYVSTGAIAFADLAVYRAHGRWVCHRVIATRRYDDGERSYLLKGDAKPYVDGWISSTEVVGRVCRVNGKSVDTLMGKVLSRCLAILNYVHFILFPHVFRGRLGKHCGRIRSLITSYPVFERLYPFCFRPWLLFHLESRQIIVGVLRDGFKCCVFYPLYQSLREKMQRLPKAKRADARGAGGAMVDS